jgi:hypothetical protein
LVSLLPHQPCGTGKERDLVATRVSPGGRGSHDHFGHCATQESGSRTQDGCERCRMDRRTVRGMACGIRQVYSLQPNPGLA